MRSLSRSRHPLRQIVKPRFQPKNAAPLKSFSRLLAISCTSLPLLAWSDAAARADPAPWWALDQGAFVCTVSVRPNQYAPGAALPDVRLSKPGHRIVNAGPFRLRIVYSSGRYDSPTFIVYVYANSTNQLIAEGYYQFDPQRPPLNQLLGGHGFTGLHYVYAPGSRAELQYYCGLK